MCYAMVWQHVQAIACVLFAVQSETVSERDVILLSVLT
jgi:hypothetical protein